ncbi:MAG: bifunctional serine/threonine-protein kinase/formylglycine-generating enzyme family protein [Polyangiaceae bacterium]
MEHHDPLNLVGTTVAEKYDVEAVVGEGGFGIVYRAMHRIWKQPVAIKCFKALMDVAPDVRESLLKDFIQEGALLSQLSGRTASIVQARDVGTFVTASGAWIPYMVLEWLEGMTLEQMLEAERIKYGREGGAAWPVEKVIALLEPVVAALDVVHRRGIAHRDIKPANIFVLAPETDEMHVKVLDFGIAKVAQSAAEHGGFTKTGGKVTSFTPAYGAPEQFSRAQGATGPWTDVYAVALVMTELLVGRAPLEGDDFIQLGMATANPNVRPTPGGFGIQLGPLEGIFLKALAVKTTERYATAGEFWQAVRGALNMPNVRMTADAPRSFAFSGGTAPVPSGAIGGPTLQGAAGVPANPNLFSSAQTELGNSIPLPGGGSGATATRANVSATNPTPAAPPSKSGVIIGGALAGIAVVAAGFFLMGRGKGDAPPAPAVTAPVVSAAPVAPSPPPLKPCAEKMASLEGGKFFMGSDDKDASEDERPAHQVTLSAYCIDLYEVTTAEYKACSDVGECKRAPTQVEWADIRPFERKPFSRLCNANVAANATHPINCVDWEMASTYCAWQKKRLPTEAEWEFAARGPDGRKYPWGDEEPDKTHMNACGKECLIWGAKNGVDMAYGGKGMYPDDDGFPATAPVGSFVAGKSRYGLYDVVGNVWEWTSDWDGKYAPEAVADPKGPPAGTRRVVRGGAFNGVMASWVRPSQRYSDIPTTHSHAYGFRCAQSR